MRAVILRGLAAAGFLTALLAAAPARAESCHVLRYTFQPDCYRAAGDALCSQSVSHLDLGPQIAVWIESADGTQFIDTLMVTNAVAARGIGNRPGLWNWLSSPKFPYGKRQMVLPIWAHRRGQGYDTVVMSNTLTPEDPDPHEDWLGFNEGYSSPEEYFCRPLGATDIAVIPSSPSSGDYCPAGWSSCLAATASPSDFGLDAITCPTKFNSSKGRFDPTLPQQYYPPRNDLTMFIDRDSADAPTYAALNDLDTVAAATPAYGQPYSGTWNIRQELAPGDYMVWVEVNKEFDTNASHAYPSIADDRLAGYGLFGNFGQPSVVYRVPIHIEGFKPDAQTTTNIQGYSVWPGDTGDMNPRDATITADPGSGEARLLPITTPAGTGRVHVALEQCAPITCDPPPPAPTVVSDLHVAAEDIMATGAVARFLQASANGAQVMGYEIRYRAAQAATLSDTEFQDATRAPLVAPADPGSPALVHIDNLKPSTHYVVGVRSQGPCMGVSPIAFADFTTPAIKFTQLSGCFVATAAYGSDMDGEVAALRALRDRLRPRNAFFAAATDLYYRSGPAAAAVLSRSDTARALARRLIGPLAGLAELAERLPAGFGL